MRLLETLSVVAFFIIVVTLGRSGLRDHDVQKLKQAYGSEAVNSLAMDAALAFPSTGNALLQTNYWSSEEIPCIFTTNETQASGNGSSTA